MWNSKVITLWLTNFIIIVLFSSGGTGNIRIDRQSGELFVVGSLKPESVYNLNITASDGRGLANVIQVIITRIIIIIIVIMYD